jgi:hypothetical protein
MSTEVSEAEASKPQHKMQECFKCKAAGFPNHHMGFEKIRENPMTGKGIWKLIDENGLEHKLRYLQRGSPQQPQLNHANSNVNANSYNRPIFRARRRVVDLAVITDLEQARKLLAQGWDYQTSYPATISNISHFVLVKKE